MTSLHAEPIHRQHSALAQGVHLVPWDLSMVPELTEACQDPIIQARMPIPLPYTQESATSFIQQVVPSFTAPGGANFAVLTAEGHLAACVSLRMMDPSIPLGRMGYWVHADFRGQGVAREAATLMEKWAQLHGFKQIELTIATDNASSQLVATHSGYEPAGRIEDFRFGNGLVKPVLRFVKNL